MNAIELGRQVQAKRKEKDLSQTDWGIWLEFPGITFHSSSVERLKIYQ
jgi:hypothetical protein